MFTKAERYAFLDAMDPRAPERLARDLAHRALVPAESLTTSSSLSGSVTPPPAPAAPAAPATQPRAGDGTYRTRTPQERDAARAARDKFLGGPGTRELVARLAAVEAAKIRAEVEAETADALNPNTTPAAPASKDK
jgi:hypothetical protein